jgi:hypothetical protein
MGVCRLPGATVLLPSLSLLLAASCVVLSVLLDEDIEQAKQLFKLNVWLQVRMVTKGLGGGVKAELEQVPLQRDMNFFESKVQVKAG